MSLLKLESLPNEILLDFLEKHVNGVDILMAFSGQLNSRIDDLIDQCQRFRFDFFRCRKDDFLLCVSLFPSLIDKISQLSLSEWNTPSQIDTFLSFFPSFRPFKNLHTLDFHFDTTTIVQDKLERALRSLRKVKNLNALSIKVGNKLSASLFRIIVELFHLPTLKRLSVSIGEYHSDWWMIRPLTPDSFNIEHLTITGIPIHWNDLQLIIQRSHHLQYVNVRLTNKCLYGFAEKISTKLNLVSTLKTLILYFEEDDDPTTFGMVTQLLRTTINLCRLEITAHDALIKASGWEQFISNSLPHLTHFLLRTSLSRLNKRILEEVLMSFQTSFWIEKNKFYLLILDDEHLLNNPYTINHICGRKRHTLHYQNTVLIHSTNKNISPTNTITSLGLSKNSSLLSCQYSFDNVRYLHIDYAEKNFVKWITKYVNCLRIEELDISLCKHDQMIIVPLITHTKNIKSLQLNAKQLITYQTLNFGTNNQLKSLTLLDLKENFNENIIQTIDQLFPRIEHLVIDTLNLDSIPILARYLPNLHSLTINISGQSFKPFYNFKEKVESYHKWEKKSQFLFRSDEHWATIWIDSAAFERGFWNVSRPNLCLSLKRSLTTNDSRKKRVKF